MGSYGHYYGTIGRARLLRERIKRKIFLYSYGEKQYLALLSRASCALYMYMGNGTFYFVERKFHSILVLPRCPMMSSMTLYRWKFSYENQITLILSIIGLLRYEGVGPNSLLYKETFKCTERTKMSIMPQAIPRTKLT